MTLPESWTVAPLGEITQINPRSFKRELDDAESISFVPMAFVEEGSGLLDASNEVPWGDVKGKSYTRFSEGDVLFAKITPCMENGKFALARGLTNDCGVGSTEFHVLRTSRGLDPKYILYFLLQEETRRRARAVMAGAVGQQRVPAQFLTDLSIPLPPLAEQHRIVAEIEKQLTRLDAAVSALERARVNLKRYRASVLQSAVEGRLVPGEADAWTEMKVKSVGKVQLGRQRSPKNRASNYPTKYIRAANLTWDGLDLSDVLEMDFRPGEFENYRLQVGDVLLSEASGSADQVGKPAVWRGEIQRCCFQNTVIRVRPGELASPDFLRIVFSHYARNGVFARASSGVGIHHLSAQRFGNLSISLPSRAVQDEVVREVDSRLSILDALESTIDNDLKRVERLRQSVLKRGFEGLLVPQDPNDEPASELLQRIREERQKDPAFLKARVRQVRKGRVQLPLMETGIEQRQR